MTAIGKHAAVSGRRLDLVILGLHLLQRLGTMPIFLKPGRVPPEELIRAGRGRTAGVGQWLNG